MHEALQSSPRLCCIRLQICMRISNDKAQGRKSSSDCTALASNTALVAQAGADVASLPWIPLMMRVSSA